MHEMRNLQIRMESWSIRARKKQNWSQLRQSMKQGLGPIPARIILLPELIIMLYRLSLLRSSLAQWKDLKEFITFLAYLLNDQITELSSQFRDPAKAL